MIDAILPRYRPEREFPPYSYVTGLFPHPTSDERGHSFGQHEPLPQPLTEANCRDHETYLYALDLFNHGYYWEAHEAWEALWHAGGRRGTDADFIKGLIKLAAAGVKAREGRAAGVRQHALRSVVLLRGQGNAATKFGLSISELVQAGESLNANAAQVAGDCQPNSNRRLPIVLRLIGESDAFAKRGLMR